MKYLLRNREVRKVPKLADVLKLSIEKQKVDARNKRLMKNNNKSLIERLADNGEKMDQ